MVTMYAAGAARRLDKSCNAVPKRTQTVSAQLRELMPAAPSDCSGTLYPSWRLQLVETGEGFRLPRDAGHKWGGATITVTSMS